MIKIKLSTMRVFIFLLIGFGFGVGLNNVQAAGSVPQSQEIIFGCLPESIVANSSGTATSWNLVLPATNLALSTIGAPSVTNLNERPFAWFQRTVDAGFAQGEYSSSIPCNGASIVAVVQPELDTADGDPWSSVVDVFHNRFVLGLKTQANTPFLWVNGQAFEFPAVTIATNEPTVMSLIVEASGAFNLWTNGVVAASGTAAAPMTSLVPNVPGSYARFISVGRNGVDGWTTFNGAIGDVFLYKTALSDADREELELFATSRLVSGGVPEVYTIVSTNNAGGTISPFGTNSVVANSTLNFVIEAGVGGTLNNVLVDGTPVGPISSYSFTNVTSDHTISALFDFVQPPTITASASLGGTISPSGEVLVPYDGSQTFTIEAEGNGTLTNVLVDGVLVGAVTNYTFSNVITDHTISALFRLPPLTGVISVNYAQSNDILPTNAVAGVVPANYWNSILQLNYANPIGLFHDSAGTPVDGFGVTLSTTAFSSWNSGAGTMDSPNKVLYSDWAVNGGGTVTFTNVPYATWDLYVYFNGWGATSNVANYTIGETTQTLADALTGPSEFPGTFVEGTDYVKFTGLTSPNVVMTVTPVSGEVYGVSAFQIVGEGISNPEYMPPLLSPLVISGGYATFVISGDTGPNYIIETSPNLVNWTGLETIPAPTLPYSWQDSNPATNSALFYRVRIGL